MSLISLILMMLIPSQIFLLPFLVLISLVTIFTVIATFDNFVSMVLHYALKYFASVATVNVVFSVADLQYLVSFILLFVAYRFLHFCVFG